MTGRMSRNKGAAGERELAKILADELGIEVQRKLGQARDGGDDIQVGKYRLEVKRREALRLDDWCEQIQAAAAPGRVQGQVTPPRQPVSASGVRVQNRLGKG